MRKVSVAPAPRRRGGTRTIGRNRESLVLADRRGRCGPRRCATTLDVAAVEGGVDGEGHCRSGRLCPATWPAMSRRTIVPQPGRSGRHKMTTRAAVAYVPSAESRRRSLPLETTLYPPVKTFLEGLGFAVKGEIGGCDLVALNAERPAARRDRRAEAALQSRTGAAGRRSRRRLRRGLARRARVAARQGARERCAVSQPLPTPRLRHARRHRRRAASKSSSAPTAPMPRRDPQAPLAPRRRASAPARRPRRRRRLARADHDRLPPARARSAPRPWRTARAARAISRPIAPTRRRSCAATSTAGSCASSAAATA